MGCKDNYFNGGVIYEIPSGNDRFELKVTPPFVKERVILYGSSSPLGEIDLRAAGGIFQVKTAAKDVGTMTRGVVIEDKQVDKPQQVLAEFAETNTIVEISKK